MQGRPDAQCPGCGSLERHRALSLFLAEHPEMSPSVGRALVVAPDPHLEAIGRRNPEYLSVDLEPGRAIRPMDLTRLDLPDRDRDLVIAYHVLEHIPDDRAAMREIARVLRTNGHAILEVPLSGDETDERYLDATPEVRARHYGQPDHVRLYGRRDFEDRLRSAGLAVEAIRVGDALRAHVVPAALDPDEVFHVARPAAA
ncbi:MAG TPA: methyltransferase domain-containing protein [Candidatus Limnocylindrales bacterium]